MPTGVFSKYDNDSFKHRFELELSIPVIVGGIPSDPKVAEGWLRSKLQESDERIREMVAEVMVEREVGVEEATKIVNDLKNLNGFKRTKAGVLYVEGRQLKAALKEAVSVAVAAKKLDMTGWGATRKWLTNFFPEHAFVLEDVLELHQRDPETGELGAVKSPSGVFQQFVHTHRGSSIQYQEHVNDAVIKATIISDHNFTTRDWAMIWTTGQLQGLGASRSQGYGKYAVTAWNRIGAAVPEVDEVTDNKKKTEK